MSVLPAPPRDEAGQLAANRYVVLGSLYDGILAACVVCGHTTGWWWRQGGDEDGLGASYHPVHGRCVDKMIELWRIMITEDSGNGLSDVPLAGAYARRAGARATTVRALSVNGGSPYFRPGMAAGTPWTAVARSVLGSVVVCPCAQHESRAVDLTREWRILAQEYQTGPGEAPVVGGCVVGPDGAVSCEWGHAPVPGSAPPWEPIERANWGNVCQQCEAEIWLGRWRGTISGWCTDCLRVSSPRPWWPVDADKPPPVVAQRAKKKPITLD